MSHKLRSMERAMQDFHQAHRQAALQEVMARFRGESTKLLSFNEVSRQLKAGSGVDRGLQEIPLEAIVGSCDRYEDFNRAFLPLQASDKERWAQVRAYIAQKGLGNIPPIMVYQIGQVYFVADGNHRVSIARQLGASHIRATVTELQTKVDLAPTDCSNDLILKIEYADFLERTKLDESRPAADLRVTAAGKYWILESQIEAHCYLAADSPDQPLSYPEAALCWYDGVYLGVAQVIQDRGLLLDFPQRTETDLYLWAFEHRATLKQDVAWEMGIGTVLSDLKGHSPPEPAAGGGNRLSRLKARLLSPKQSLPETGQWQREKLAASDQSRLFFNVLVALTGEEKGWYAFEQGVEIARREGGRLRGLHLVATEEDKSGQAGQALRAEFDERCQAANVSGQLALESGPAIDKICERAWLADIVVAPLLNPPGSKLMTRLSSDFRALVQRCARPILALPDQPSPLTQALLAYDGSPKAQEALFVATYLAGRWGVPLLVLTVAETKGQDQATEADARGYLEEQGIEAHFVQASGSVAEAVLAISEAYGADLIIMGSYSRRPLKNLVLGDSVDEVLTRSKQPILICR